MKYDNHPLVADHMYAGKLFNREKPENNLYFEKQALHAFRIKFKNLKGEELEVEAPLPEKFLEAEEILKTL